jgi:hypothetical protein
MQVNVGDVITSTLIDPAGDYDRLGARIEVPITEAIVSPWADAVLSGQIWTVNLDPLLEPGDFLLYWMTPDSPATFREPIPITAVPAGTGGSSEWVKDFPPVDVPSCTPTVQEVADLEYTRAINDDGDEVDDFTPDTRPSDAQVTRLITQAVQGVIGQLRPAFPTDYYDDVRHMVCLYTAILIEGSFFREQQANEGAMANYRLLLTNGINNLNSSIEYDLKQWNASGGRIEPPFVPVRDPWQLVGMRW